jgi:hypothetical protein
MTSRPQADDPVPVKRAEPPATGNEEYARHNGHADLSRQAIDGSVGE